MFTARSAKRAIATSLFTLGMATTPCWAGVVFYDGTFNYPTGFSPSTFNSDTTNVTTSVSQNSSTGNPAPSLEFTDSWSLLGITFNTVTGVLENSWTYNPTIQGAIQSLSFSVDKNLTLTGGSLATNNAGAFLFQGGKYYFDQIIGPSLVQGIFQNISASGLTASDFELIDFTTGLADSNQHPDFSSSGGVIDFGFRSSLSHNNPNPNGGGELDILIDNLTYAINVPEPGSLAIIGGGLLGLVGLLRRRKAKPI